MVGPVVAALQALNRPDDQEQQWYPGDPREPKGYATPSRNRTWRSARPGGNHAGRLRRSGHSHQDLASPVRQVKRRGSGVQIDPSAVLSRTRAMATIAALGSPQTNPRCPGRVRAGTAASGGHRETLSVWAHGSGSIFCRATRQCRRGTLSGDFLGWQHLNPAGISPLRGSSRSRTCRDRARGRLVAALAGRLDHRSRPG
jgi:hypothetical protein